MCIYIYTHPFICTLDYSHSTAVRYIYIYMHTCNCMLDYSPSTAYNYMYIYYIHTHLPAW